MGSWRPLIHVSCCYSSVVSGFVNNFIDLLRWGDVCFSQILDKDTSLFVRSYFQVIFVRINQVPQFLHIKFYQWHFNSKFDILSARSNGIKNMLNHSGNYTGFYCYLLSYVSFHCVCFPWSCLSIGKYCSIESFNHTFYDWSSWVVVNFLLFCCDVEYLVKWEFQTVFQIFDFRSFNCDCFLIQ